MLQEIKNVVERGFSGKQIIVVGDLMLDRYIMGKVDRVSPEAPVPVLQSQNEKQTLGGAGNVALNLKGLDITVRLLGMIGSDLNGEKIKSILKKNSISSEHLLSTDWKPTITKTRVVAEHQQIVRIDEENIDPVPDDLENQLIEEFNSILKGHSIDAVIISDYAKGLITEKVSRSVIQAANRNDVPVVVDPKGEDFTKYKRANVVMPNEPELEHACGTSFGDEYALRKAAKELQKKLNVDYVVVTRGAKGISFFDKDEEHTIPAKAREVYDVSGAGDTVIAVATAGSAVGLPMKESLELANLAAGYVVSKFGTHPITYAELSDVIHRQLSNGRKQFDQSAIDNRLKSWRANNEKMVFTNGCFDIIHAGHIHLLDKAKQEGDKLIVGINTDDSVRNLKGDNRPVNNLEDRMRVLEAISYVDAIIPFNEATPLQLINRLKPDVLVKGADYKEEEIVGAKEVKSWGGKITRIPLVEGKSSTKLIQQGLKQ